MEVSPELRLTPRSSGQLLWPDYLVPIDGRWPIHALPRTPLSRLVRPAQRAVAQRLRALALRFTCRGAANCRQLEDNRTHVQTSWEGESNRTMGRRLSSEASRNRSAPKRWVA